MIFKGRKVFVIWRHLNKHRVKSVRIRSYSDPHFLAFRLNTERSDTFYAVKLLIFHRLIADFRDLENTRNTPKIIFFMRTFNNLSLKFDTQMEINKKCLMGIFKAFSASSKRLFKSSEKCNLNQFSKYKTPRQVLSINFFLMSWTVVLERSWVDVSY